VRIWLTASADAYDLVTTCLDDIDPQWEGYLHIHRPG
jgi:hypothetical protein